MNLLPFVVIFIFVLTLGIQFSFTSYKRVALEKLGMEGAIYVHREAYNKREKKLFRREKPPIPPLGGKAEEKVVGRDEKDYVSHREHFTENSKFCLDPLLQGNHSHLEKTLERLLDLLYANMELVEREKKRDEHFLHFFVQEMLKGLKETKSLTSVRFQDKKMQRIWYKMLKGTFDNQTGWPPLSNYVFLNGKKDRKPIIFRKCAKPILEAFFGEEIAYAIGEKEKEKFVKGAKLAVLTAEELSSLLAGKFSSERQHLGYQNMPVATASQKINDPKSGVYIIAPIPIEKEEEDSPTEI